MWSWKAFAGVADRDTQLACVALARYGSRTDASTVGAVADELAARLPVQDVLLVANGHYFCLACPCPDAAGVRFDPAVTRSAADSTFAGLVALQFGRLLSIRDLG
jgi:hypothetical protein